jgi:hypothetical protein
MKPAKHTMVAAIAREYLAHAHVVERRRQIASTFDDAAYLRRDAEGKSVYVGPDGSTITGMGRAIAAWARV